MKPGDILDGEGGYCAWGKLVPAARSMALGALPIGLAHGVALARPVAHGSIITRADLAAAPEGPAAEARAMLEAEVSPRLDGRGAGG